VNRGQIRHDASLALGVLLFAVAIWILHRELSSFRYTDLVRAVRALPAGRIVVALGLTAANYATLTGYDGLALRYVRHPLPHRRVAFASFVGYAVSNTFGFPLLTGAPLRFRLYSRWGVPAVDIARIVAFYTTTFWLGLLAVGGIAFLVDPLATPAFLHVPVATLRPVGALLLLLLAGYLALSLVHRRELRVRGITLSVPRPRLALAQVAISSLDWLLVAAVLYVLLPPGTLSYPAFLGVFALGQIAGLLSHVPGGVGVFESVLLLFLTPGLVAPEVLGILLVYRAIYYLVPLAVAALGLAVYEGRRLTGRLAAAAPLAEWVASLVPQTMAVLVFLGGMILLFSGAVPAAGGRLAWLDRVFPLAVIELSHLLASAVGVGLLLLARGLQLRLNAAFHLAVGLLAGGIVFSLFKGLDYEEAIALAVVLVGLWLSRGEFYRPAALLSERFTPGWIAAVAAVLGASAWLGFFAYKHVEYSSALWWRFAPGADAPRFLRATVAAVVVLGAVALGRLLRPAPPGSALPGPEELARAAAIVARSSRTDANLALLGDKALLFSESGEGFLMYGVKGRSWVAMGDPVGPVAEQRELAWRFRELCDGHAAWPVFYQVRPPALPIYLDMGLTLSKLGEEARVLLEEFSLEGARRKGLRHTLNHAERDGACFEVALREAVPGLLPELRVVSDAWLAGKSTAEKGFSLGRFDEAYLSHFPMALVRREGRIVGFANLWTAAPGAELSVDLMRYADEAPEGVMEYLFTKLMLWGRERGYRWFSLGMAPLAGFEARRHAPLWNRLGSLLFRHGEHFYNFQGLRAYKEKFGPVWEPRYLASPGGLALPRVLTHVSALISGGLRGVVAR
jgi:phosphatidylglycerol lysyltransferase